MDVKTVTGNYVAKYIRLLNNIKDDRNILAAFKASILCTENNRKSEQNGNESSNIDHCQYCYTSWQHGHFVVHTLQKCQIKNRKLKKKYTTAKSCIMAMKCLVCLNVTSSVFNKNKISNNQCVEKLPTSLPAKSIYEISKVEEEIIDKSKTDTKKSKKKKRNKYAGLNPLVFKHKDLCRKNEKNQL